MLGLSGNRFWKNLRLSERVSTAIARLSGCLIFMARLPNLVSVFTPKYSDRAHGFPGKRSQILYQSVNSFVCCSLIAEVFSFATRFQSGTYRCE